jgi:hypothetical protein
MIHKVDNGFTISAYGKKRAGFYEDERTAKFAFRFRDSDLQALTDEAAPNPVTFEMLVNRRKADDIAFFEHFK